jgi:hypothetical protein
MVGRRGMCAEFWIGKLFVNALMDDHGNDGRELRRISSSSYKALQPI